MADTSDGSLVFDTTLDDTGFDKGSDKLLKAVQDLTDSVDYFGSQMTKAFEQAIPLLQNIANAATGTYQAISEGGQAVSEANTQVAGTEQQVATQAQQANTAMQQQSQELNTVASSATSAKSNLSGLEKEVNSVAAGMESVSRSAELGFSNGKSVLAFDTKLDAMETKIESAKQKLAEFGNQKLPTEDYQWLNTEIQKAETALDRLLDRQVRMKETGTKTNSKSWKALVYDIEQAQEKLRVYKAERDDLENTGGAYTTGAAMAEYARMQESLTAAGQQLETNRALIDSEAVAQARLNVQAAQEGVALARTDSERRVALVILQQMQTQLQNVAAASSDAANTSESAFARFASTIRTAVSNSVDILTAKFPRTAAAVRAVGKASTVAYKAISNFAKVSFKGVINGAKKAASAMKNYITKSRETSLTANGLTKSLFSLKRMLLSRVKGMFISQIFNGMKNDVNILTQFSSAFNQSMSNIKNSASQLSANLGVTLGNLISAIEPVLTTVINAISKAVSYLNAFFAMLGGKSTMTVAKKQTASYADSLSDASASADKASDSQKELNNQVYGFDELNKRSKDTSSNSDSGSGGGVTDGSNMFEEVPIDSVLPDSVKNFFEKIKSAFKAGDYEEVGRTIATGLNAGMKIVDDWINNTFRPLGVKWASIVARILNGLVDGFDWGLMGKTVADGINSVFDILNTFLTTFDFQALGTGIGKAVNGLFDNIQWDLLGQTFANKWNAVVNFIFGIVSTVNWSKIGDSFATFVNNASTTFNMDKVASTLSTGINGIKDMLMSFITKTDWKGMATRLGTSVNQLFTDIDWVGIVKMLGAGVSSIASFFSTLISTIDWANIGSQLAAAVTAIPSSIDWAAFGQLIGGFFTGEMALIGGFIENMDWYKFGSDLLSGLVTMITSVDWISLIGHLGNALISLMGGAVELLLGAIGGLSSGIGDAFESIGLDGIAGFFKGLGDALANVGSWIKENIIDPVVNAVKNFFGIHSPSTVFAEIGGFLIDGLFNGISGAWSAITGFFSSVASGLGSLLSGAWEGIKSTASSAWEGIKSTVTGAFDRAKSALSSTAEKIGSGLSSAWENVKSTASSAWSNVKSTVTVAFDSAKTTLSSTAEKIGSGLSSAWESVKSTASTAWSNVKSTVTSAFDNTKSTVTSTAGNLGSGLSTAWANVKSGGASAWNALKSTLTSTFSSTKAAIDSTSSNLKSSLSSAWNSMKSTASSVWSGIKSSLQSTMSGIKSNTDSSTSGMSSTISSRFSNMKSTMVSNMQNAASSIKNQSWYSIGSNICSGISSGINSGWSWLSSTVGNLARNLLRRAKSALGIHSPSRLFRDEIGENIGLGLAEGIEGTTATVLDTVSNLANATANGFDTQMPTLETAESSTVSGLDAVADRLAGIADTFRSITSMLEAIGGLQMPQIGAGTVVPYKTKVDTTETENKAYEAISDLTGGLDERMADMSYILKQILAIVKSLNLNIDIDALADAITQQQRSKIRNFGGA
ncbi:MAG: hypothetical protein PHS82_03050 [Lachnospiraceae bacterium]|nr:hypothetical protein [Lachnospiraceae bacterium]